MQTELRWPNGFRRALTAIQLNFQRRQISPAKRRKTIQQIKKRKNWRGKPSSHVKDLSQLLGVSKATISNDINEIWSGEEEEEIREERKRINYLLTGLRYLDKGDVEKPDLSEDFDDDEIEVGERYLTTLQNHLEARRQAINQKLKGETA